MPYNETLAQHLRGLLKRHKGIVLLKGNMCVGVYKESLILRVGPEAYDELLQRPHICPFDITGRAMSGCVMAEKGAWENDAVLSPLVELAVDYVQALPAKKKASRGKSS